jgi:predicted RNA-binding protein with PUA-like domain
MAKRHWLMKTEPEEFSITDLERVKIEPWSGVRNFMARAYMRQMSVDDGVLFYHSSCEPPGVAGLARVIHTGVVDEKQFDTKGKYYDPRATREKPIWDCVDVEYVRAFPHFVTLDRLRRDPDVADMMVLKKGMRLSVQPVTEQEFDAIVAMSATPSPPPLPKPKPPTKPKAKAKAKKAKPTAKAKKLKKGKK